MRKVVFLVAAVLATGCAPSKQYTDDDVPKLPKLGDVMWAMSQSVDPQFKKVGKDSYCDEDYSAFAAAAERVRLASARIRKDFTSSAEFGKFNEALSKHAAELSDASYGKEAVKVSKALEELRDTCRGCHKALR